MILASAVRSAADNHAAVTVYRTTSHVTLAGQEITDELRVVESYVKQAQRRIEQLDEALKALTGLGGVGGTAAGRGRTQISGAKRRTMSAAARQRIAADQRARWAKWKAAQRAK